MSRWSSSCGLASGPSHPTPTSSSTRIERRVVVVVEVAGADPESVARRLDERNLVIGGAAARQLVCAAARSCRRRSLTATSSSEFRCRLPIEYERIAATYEDGFLLVARADCRDGLPADRANRTSHLGQKDALLTLMAQKTNQQHRTRQSDRHPAAAGGRALSAHRHSARGRQEAGHPARRGGAARRQADRFGRPARSRDRRSRVPTTCSASARSASSRRCSRCPTARCAASSPGSRSFKIEQFTQVAPYMVAAYTELPDTTVENEELVAMQRNLAGLFQKLLSYLPQAPREMEMEVANITDPVVLTYFVASTMRLETADRQALLEERDTAKRMRKLTLLLTKELEVVELGHKIQSDIQREMEKNQREFYLRQQLRAIQEELGEVDPQQAETNELRTKIDAAAMPEDVKKAADRELDRLSKVPQASPEYSVIRTYLDWLVTLPWNRRDGRSHRHHSGARDSRRGPLRSREDQGPHRRVSRRRQAQEEADRPDPLLRRTAGRRQDVARAVDRARDGTQVRAALGRRRARRGRDPRASPHVYRRDAGNDRPRDARCRHAQSRDDDRRDRQGRRRFSRRPAVGAARSARSRAEQQLPRSLSRSALRSLASALHLHREHARHDLAAAARSHGDHHALGLYRAREAADRQALSAEEAAPEQRLAR